jgi:hypothetical protein
MIVKIDHSTIKKNPQAGNTTTVMTGRWDCKFEFDGELPKELHDDEDIILTKWSMDANNKHIRGIIVNPTKVDAMTSIGAKVTQTKDNIPMYHLPEPKYLFKYENPSVECSNCHAMIPVNDIEEDWIECGEDEHKVQICPVCKSTNPDNFEEIEYESIESAI